MHPTKPSIRGDNQSYLMCQKEQTCCHTLSIKYLRKTFSKDSNNSHVFLLPEHSFFIIFFWLDLSRFHGQLNCSGLIVFCYLFSGVVLPQCCHYTTSESLNSGQQVSVGSLYGQLNVFEVVCSCSSHIHGTFVFEFS